MACLRIMSISAHGEDTVYSLREDCCQCLDMMADDLSVTECRVDENWGHPRQGDGTGFAKQLMRMPDDVPFALVSDGKTIDDAR